MGISHIINRGSCLKHVKQISTKNSSVDVELICKKMITPSSPTPKHLRHYKLSLLDQLLTTKYIPVTLFYPKTSTSSSSSSLPLFTILEKSMAKLLSFYYPFAGKLVENTHVDCNDRGALFTEVLVKGSMSDTLTMEFSRVQGILFPGHGLPWTEPIDEEGGPLAVAQLTHFDCGGIAISLGLSHKIGDGYSFFKFYNDWAQLAKNSTGLTNPPLLKGSSLLQPKDDPFTAHLYEVSNKQHLKVVRLMFNDSNIKRLKAIVSSESDVKDPTRFEVVAAVVNICAAKAANNNTSSSFDPFNVYIPMNLRKLINPPVPHLLGNFLSFVLVNVSEENDLKLPKLVSKIRMEKMKNMEKYQGKSKDEVMAKIIEEEREFPIDSELRLSTSLCSYPTYDISFGWGRPGRVTIGAIRNDNYFVFLEALQKGGVDVIAALDQSVALKFKTDKDVLDFASVDPSY